MFAKLRCGVGGALSVLRHWAHGHGIPRDNIGFLPESTNFMLFQLIDLSMWGSMLPNNGTMMLRSNLSIPFTKSKRPL
jgi:hypothetical protein